IAAMLQGVLLCHTVPEKQQALADALEVLTTTAGEVDPIDGDYIWELAYRKSVQKMAELAGMNGSDWERMHLETPIMPKRKPKPGSTPVADAPGSPQPTDNGTASEASSESPADQRA